MPDHEGIYEWKYAKEQKEETIATHDGSRNTAFTINRPTRCPHVCSGALCLPRADAKVDRIVAAPLAQRQGPSGSLSFLEQANDLLFEDCDVGRTDVLSVDAPISPYQEGDR